ncbi:hypothetical protein AB664_07275 [Brucella anthropi]|uniref:Uncharacterized protein n=1 Tax=Brucella anthropi TaxID=529 RepID=A0A656Z481_BRUAN|nr:hypothetical protein AB664_07275 [Brucella anthropi]
MFKRKLLKSLVKRAWTSERDILNLALSTLKDQAFQYVINLSKWNLDFYITITRNHRLSGYFRDAT